MENDEVNFRVFMAETVIYREEQANRMDRISTKIDGLSEKIDVINSKVGLLPCRERAHYYEWYSGQVKILWVFISGIVLAIIATWIKQ